MHFKSSVHHSWTPETSQSDLWTLVGGQMARYSMHKDAGTAPQQLHGASHSRNCQQKPGSGSSWRLVTVTLCSPIVYSPQEKNFHILIWSAPLFRCRVPAKT